MKIGIPRALLYYRDGALWQTFFETLGHEVVLSAPTDRAILEQGQHRAIDEACLACKVYLGHVASLVGRCDCVFVPRVANFGPEGIFCTKFEALPDMVRNLFRADGLEVLDCEVDGKNGIEEQDAASALGWKLGATVEEAKDAYEAGLQARRDQWLQQIKQQEEALKQTGLKILLVGHDYNVFDAYVGAPICRALERMETTPIFAAVSDHDTIRAAGLALSPTLPWTVSREQLGVVSELSQQVDGIILMSAFPCGPDSMVNDLLVRKLHGIPVLTLTLDAQDASAGLETRLESFVDILRFRQEAVRHG